MKITKLEIPIGEIAKGYQDNNEDGVIGYDGKLEIKKYVLNKKYYI